MTVKKSPIQYFLSYPNIKVPHQQIINRVYNRQSSSGFIYILIFLDKLSNSSILLRHITLPILAKQTSGNNSA